MQTQCESVAPVTQPQDPPRALPLDPRGMAAVLRDAAIDPVGFVESWKASGQGE